MKKTILFVFCFFSVFVKAQTGFVWADHFVGNLGSEAPAICTDVSGNIYTAGQFEGTVDFDPGPGTFTLSSFGNWDAFITKLDPAGNLIWAKQLGGTQGDWGMDMILDPLGNIYITGEFEGTSDLDPGPSVSVLTATGFSGDVFVTKLDVNGNFIWAKRLGGTNSCEVRAISLDGSSSLCITGTFGGTVDFDPGPATYTMTDGGNGNVYVTKLDASGNFVWAKQIIGTSGSLAMGIAFDGAGNVYTTGRYSGTQDFDSGPSTFTLTSSALWDVFIMKLDASGNLVWVKSVGGPNYDIGIDITTDAAGNVYTTGQFYNTVDFDPGPAIFNLSTTVTDVFILKLDPSGNFVWAKNFNGTVKSIVLDASNNIYTTGGFTGTGDFDPSTAVSNYTSNGSYDIFISKLDASGNFLWTQWMGGTGLDTGQDIALDAAGNIYTSGYFDSTVDFDPGSGTYNLTGSSFSTVFIHKMNSSVGMEEFSKKNIFSAFPNPNSGNFTLKVDQPSQVTITNSLGVVLFKQNLPIGNHKIEVQALQSTLCYLTISSENKFIETKLISIIK